MKNIYDLMRQKELEIGRLQEEIEALRMVAPMLEDNEGISEIAAAAFSTPNNTYSSIQRVADVGTAARV